ncbi:MAG TPA: hypothetical protein VN577_05325 [Terriglobales bacterium]|nr:hypothetical protein [Terriglobales bacterium]
MSASSRRLIRLTFQCAVQSLLRFSTVVLMAAVAALLSSTCMAGGIDWPNSGDASVHPLWVANDPHVIEERLLGTWFSYLVLDLGIMIAPISTRVQVTANRATAEYQLVFSSLPDRRADDPEFRIVFQGFLVRLNGQLFLDVTTKNEKPKLHRVFLVVLDKGIPRLIRWRFLLAENWSKKLQLDKDSVARADSRTLRQFVAEHAHDTMIFPTANEDCGESCLGKVPHNVFPLLPQGMKPVTN